MMRGVAVELPVVQPGPRPERADAARNRRRILAAAAELVGERGIDAVSMHDVAARAAVGTGTLYRRFGDRSGLAFALLDESTRAFQDALIAGPPPLGPGAAAPDRLLAFVDGYVSVLEQHAPLMAAAEPSGRDGPGPHEMYATHLAVLLRDAAPAVDAHFAAEALLAPLAPATYLRMRRGLGWPVERVCEGWRALVRALTATGA